MATEIIPIPKKAWLSKTMWVNLFMGIIALVAAWVPQVSEIMNKEAVIMVFAMINMILRLVTKDKIVLW